MQGVRALVRKHIFLDEDLLDWIQLQASRQNRPLGEVIRHHLKLARKYENALQAAENAPVRFVRDVRSFSGQGPA